MVTMMRMRMMIMVVLMVTNISELDFRNKNIERADNNLMPLRIFKRNKTLRNDRHAR